jgi:hypothetical protein
VSDWYQLKLFAEHALGISMDSLHVIIGVIIQFGAAMALRTQVTRWRPWLIVLAVELANEWADLHVEKWPDLAMQYGEGAKDILLTMLLPTLILAAGRLRPALLAGRRPSKAAVAGQPR